MQEIMQTSRINDSVKIIEERAKKGNIGAEYLYSYILFKGTKDVPINKEEGAKYLKKIANSNVFYFNKLRRFYSIYINKGYDKEAMFSYANMLYEGKEISGDKALAAKYYEMAANLGHIDACYRYASMLKRGDGIKVDRKRAKKYFKKVARNRRDVFLKNLAKENLKNLRSKILPMGNSKNVVKLIFHNILNFIFLTSNNF